MILCLVEYSKGKVNKGKEAYTNVIIIQICKLDRL